MKAIDVLKVLEKAKVGDTINLILGSNLRPEIIEYIGEFQGFSIDTANRRHLGESEGSDNSRMVEVEIVNTRVDWNKLANEIFGSVSDIRLVKAVITT